MGVGQEGQARAAETGLARPTVAARTDPDSSMAALSWFGKKNVKVHQIPRPLVTDPVREQRQRWRRTHACMAAACARAPPPDGGSRRRC